MKAPARRARRQSLLLPLIAVALLLGIAVTSQHRAAGLPSGPAAGDRFAATGDLVLTPGEVVEHDAIALLGNVVVPAGAHVKHDVRTGKGSITIAGTVDHDVQAVDGNVKLEPSAVVGHDVTIRNGQFDRAAGAHVGHDAPVSSGAAAVPNGDGGLLGLVVRLLVNLVLAVVAVAVGTVIVLAWPRQIGRVATTLDTMPWPAAAVGLLTGVLLPPVAAVLSLVLLITIVGSILIPVLWLLVLLGWLYGTVVVGLWAGHRLADSGHVPLAHGSLLVTAATGLSAVIGLPLLLSAVLPWLGWPLAYCLGCLGLGAVVLSRLGSPLSIPHLTRSTGPRVTHPLPPRDRSAS